MLVSSFVFRIASEIDCGDNPTIDKATASNNSDLAIITDDNPREELPSKIRQDILQGCPNAIEIADRNSAIKFGVSKLQDNDLLLIAGKGHESTQTIGTESLPFDASRHQIVLSHPLVPPHPCKT